ncbi:histone-lysine N-methyltransferase 2D-like [Physella acuta]|uniref:histone-lysine N-methyltransferase 2D-like n=1 Tax=Physella acuta TaxID=109671 RepID=UPI0027DC284B|nr:histone-lysine N-methyltransferase 2D-like [Physella acuta]
MATISQKHCFESCRENPQCIKYTYAIGECIQLVGKDAVPDVLFYPRRPYTLFKRFTCDLSTAVPLSHSTTEPVPSNTTPELEPTVTSTEPRHLGLTPEKEPSCALTEKEPSTALPEKEPSTTHPEKEPSTTLPEKERSTTLPEKERSTTLPEKERSTTLPEKEPITTLPEKEPSTTLPEKERSTTLPEKEPITTLPEKERSTTLPEKERSTTLPEKEPTPALPEKEPTPALPEKEPFLTPPITDKIYKQQPSGEYIEVDPTVYRQQHPEKSLKSTTDKQPKRKIPLLNLLMSGKGLCLRAGDQEKTVEGEIGSSMTGEQPSITINVLMMPPYQQDSSRP